MCLFEDGIVEKKKEKVNIREREIKVEWGLIFYVCEVNLGYWFVFICILV